MEEVSLARPVDIYRTVKGQHNACCLRKRLSFFHRAGEKGINIQDSMQIPVGPLAWVFTGACESL